MAKITGHEKKRMPKVNAKTADVPIHIVIAKCHLLPLSQSPPPCAGGSFCMGRQGCLRNKAGPGHGGSAHNKSPTESVAKNVLLGFAFGLTGHYRPNLAPA